ncbi:MAG TPA: DUF2680 domain-containing protein [Clostridia bacterium]|nr:DUF2680 domain-containing protein [Clostridia bacterium]
MKRTKKLAALLVAIGMIGILGTAGAVYAATTAKTPAEIVSGLTGKSVEDLNKERASGKKYGTIAKEAGKLDEFKAQMLEQKKAVLDQRVKNGTLTQQQADQIYNNIKNNQATCDGTGNAAIGRNNGAGFGGGHGMGQGRGCGMGMGNRTGNCLGYGEVSVK